MLRMSSLAMALCVLAAFAVHAEIGVSPTVVTIGQSIALSGPLAELGGDMNAGALAWAIRQYFVGNEPASIV